MSTQIDRKRSKDEMAFTVKQVAEKLGKTPGRIRQLCREHDLGVNHENRFRMLSRRNVEFLEKYFSESGHVYSQNAG